MSPEGYTAPLENVTIYVTLQSPIDNLFLEDPATLNIRVFGTSATLDGPDIINCPGTFDGASAVTVQWPFFCPSNVPNITVSVDIPPQLGGVYVQAVQGDFAARPDLIDYVSALHRDTLLLPGSRLIGKLSWTKREIISQVRWGISTSPLTTLFTAEMGSLQTYPSNDTSESNTATLVLLQRFVATKLVQDTVDTTALSGIATFGGFWTFLNGAFNVLRQLAGRRPLSALGLAHVFQRRALVRRWHEDFPAIHTEGGTPGSESAGIVAFIRERLVDLGDDPRDDPKGPHDIETQTTPAEFDAVEQAPYGHSRLTEDAVESGSPARAGEVDRPGRKPGYILDNIPFLDVHLGLDAVLSDGLSRVSASHADRASEKTIVFRGEPANLAAQRQVAREQIDMLLERVNALEDCGGRGVRPTRGAHSDK
ncbi:hypothetical protein FB451DRAFT_1519275 [Mycena latifolia]|nr:hypothetical protein FB451DRAFT_1519275 [Mycena latifolia]